MAPRAAAAAVAAVVAAAAALAPRCWRFWRRHRWLPYLVFDDYNDYALVYSVSKVASTSLWVALGSHRELWGYYEEVNETYTSIAKTHFLTVALDFLRKVPSGKRIWVFTSTRDPFATRTSRYFEDIEQERHLAHLSQEQLLATNVTELHRDFLEKWQLDLQDQWFSRFFQEAVGVNVASEPFPFWEGKLMLEGRAFGKEVVVVLLRAEDVRYWWDIMRHNVPTWVPVHKQNALDLWYNPKYQEFKRTFVWPGWAVEALSLGESARFYTIAERAAMCYRALNTTTELPG